MKVAIAILTGIGFVALGPSAQTLLIPSPIATSD
jgi:hypothetical protein